MAEFVDYYQVLDVPSHATASDIKRAYHAAAKRAHPDAGGNQAAMERVNEAYRVLSSTLDRRDFDRRRAERHSPHHTSSDSTGAAQAGAQARTSTHPRPRTDSRPHPEATAQADAPQAAPPPPQAAPPGRRETYATIRQMAWEKLKIWSALALGLGILIYTTAPHIARFSTRVELYLLGFAPVYGLILSLVFMISPEVRLNLYRIVRPRATRANREDYLVALVLFALFFALSVVWIGVIQTWANHPVVLPKVAI